MRLPSRNSADDADVIRARLRALLAEGSAAGGWIPDDDLGLPAGDAPDVEPLGPVRAWSLPDEEPTPDASGLPDGIGRHRAPGPAVRLDPGRRGARSLWLAGLLGVLVLLAWTWWERPRVQAVPPAAHTAVAARSSTPPSSPPVGETARTSGTVVVSVVGEVARPGLVTLSQGARVADAIEAAGGLLPGADAASVNLAAVVSDGQQISVGVPAAAAAGTSGGSAATSGTPIDLNAATAAELDALPGIGPVLAQRIVSFRQEHGRFASVDQLNDVPGIGPALYARLAPLVRV